MNYKQAFKLSMDFIAHFWMLFFLMSALVNNSVAQVSPVPHVFSAGQAARASQINDNFNVLTTRIENLEDITSVQRWESVNCSSEPDALKNRFALDTDNLVRSVRYEITGRCNSPDYFRPGLLVIAIVGVSPDAALVNAPGRALAGVTGGISLGLSDLTIEANGAPAVRVNAGNNASLSNVRVVGSLEANEGSFGLSDVVIEGNLKAVQTSSVYLGGTRNIIQGTVNLWFNSMMLNRASLVINELESIADFNILSGSNFRSDGPGVTISGFFRLNVTDSFFFSDAETLTITGSLLLERSNLTIQGNQFSLSASDQDGRYAFDATMSNVSITTPVSFNSPDQHLILRQSDIFLESGMAGKAIPVTWILEGSSARINNTALDTVIVRKSTLDVLGGQLNSGMDVQQGSSVSIGNLQGEGSIGIWSSYVSAGGEPLDLARFYCRGPSTLDTGTNVTGSNDCLDWGGWYNLVKDWRDANP